MATHYSANQYQSAFTPKQLQSWNVPKAYKERPSDHDGYTQFIANERGHLLPGVPRSQKNPWGTFIGTWDLPTKIPPSKVSLTSRSAVASRRLTNWIQNSEALLSACNGLHPHISGKVPTSPSCCLYVPKGGGGGLGGREIGFTYPGGGGGGGFLPDHGKESSPGAGSTENQSSVPG
uniref:Protein Flattop n=2 Tax=Xenopus tropicalis TaxID=8364 RepID=A0A803JRN5_XENTR